MAAQAGSPGRQVENPGLLSMIWPMILMFIIMYIILIKPQQKKQKQHQEMIKRIKSGDKAVTNGGIHGTIAAVKDHTVLLKVADNVRIEVNRGNIAELLTNDTNKNN